MQFVFGLVFLARQTLVAIALNRELVIESLNISVTICNDGSLPVQLGIELCVLLSPFVVQRALLVYVSTKSLDEPDVSVDTALVVFVHPPLIFIQTAKVLFQVQKLVLKGPVVPLFGSEFVCFLHQLRD